ncbi:type III PLP-dependent enzyme domain-containing protein [Actinokineospora iranica]|uniref:Diaminopimelate decarboxylase n=1 Tax=Actinokineospora iranica TaxID=1271860 RepID=A0A1G6UE52_9PSEU|nr:alanine racemase [Actinokineospora iranica]SDD39539.1 diaminopimelate decarboxylase [Actinokineospora iranica]
METDLFLTPLVDGLLREVLDAPDTLFGMVEALGSPLNLVAPRQIAENVARYRAVLGKHHLGGGVFFAHKANRSSALVRELAAGDAGVDVASLGELRHVLAAGFSGDRIMATGPKDADFLWLAARVGAVVNADSREELAELASIVARHRLPAVRVMVRLSAFDSPGVRVLSRLSRFGVHARELGAVLDLLDAHRDELDLHGMAYHLDTNGLPEKAAALEGCLLAMREAAARGFAPTAVDIGGGFGVNYLVDQGEWERYTTELSNAVLGARSPMTWQNHGYGLRAEAGTLRGALGVYPSHRPVAGADYLDALLDREAPSLGRPLATLLLESLYDLHVEPGRALVDQCGLTLARVAEVRATHAGDTLVRLAANSRDISMEDHAVLADPVLLPARPAPVGPVGPVGVYLSGNLCLEDDLITRRKVALPRVPVPGDLLAFANTAGYFMDFAADHALMQPIARKVAVFRAGGAWKWCLDDQYWPVKGDR